ncbi:MAG: hypothetical protein KY391_00260 [Actinobacteria bacterium]|nr:hypothetical protein [Actinomycetota bacterium]
MIAFVGCSPDPGCDGSVVEVEGPVPNDSYWKNPFKGEVVSNTADAELPFEPVEPDLAYEPEQIAWTNSGVSQNTGRFSRLSAAPGATAGPRIVWAYETADGRFFVQQGLVTYGQRKLEQEASECDVSGRRHTNPGFSMTELEGGQEALLVAQSIVMSVIWIDDATITDESAVAAYENVFLETQIRAPGDELTVDQLLEIANDVQH